MIRADTFHKFHRQSYFSQSEPSWLLRDNSDLLTPELIILLKEVEKLREETASIICNCRESGCPFATEIKCDYEKTHVKTEELTNVKGDVAKEYEKNEQDHENFKESKCPDFMELMCPRKSDNSTSQFSLPRIQLTSPPLSYHHDHHHSDPIINSSSTNTPRGTQKRVDGTILESDYPDFFCSSSSSKYKKKYFGGFSLTSHLNRLDICSIEVSQHADCKVDEGGENRTNKDYKFSREAPERKNVRSHTEKNRICLDHSLTKSTPIRRKGFQRISLGLPTQNKCPSRELTRQFSVPAFRNAAEGT